MPGELWFTRSTITTFRFSIFNWNPCKLFVFESLVKIVSISTSPEAKMRVLTPVYPKLVIYLQPTADPSFQYSRIFYITWINSGKIKQFVVLLVKIPSWRWTVQKFEEIWNNRKETNCRYFILWDNEFMINDYLQLLPLRNYGVFLKF